MKILGIGNVTKKDITSILTPEAKKAIKSGDMTLEEASALYKIEQVRKCSECGIFGETFNANYQRIPQELRNELSPEYLGKLVDAFRECYQAGAESAK